MQYGTLCDWREELSTPEAAEAMEQTDYLCPECQLNNRDHRYLYETTDRDGEDTYCCPVCEKTYPVAEWLMLMAEPTPGVLEIKAPRREMFIRWKSMEYALS